MRRDFDSRGDSRPRLSRRAKLGSLAHVRFVQITLRYLVKNPDKELTIK